MGADCKAHVSSPDFSQIKDPVLLNSRPDTMEIAPNARHGCVILGRRPRELTRHRSTGGAR